MRLVPLIFFSFRADVEPVGSGNNPRRRLSRTKEREREKRSIVLTSDSQNISRVAGGHSLLTGMAPILHDSSRQYLSHEIPSYMICFLLNLT